MITRTKYYLILLPAALIIILIIGLVVSQQIDRSGKIPIEIVALPEDTTVEIDGDIYKDGKIYVKPGKYTIYGHRGGFDSIRYNINIVDENQKVFVLLGPSDASTEAQEWYEKNADKYTQAELDAGEQETSDSKTLLEKNPIINKLPISNYLYSIGYKIDPSDETESTIIITVNSSEQYRSAAIRKLNSLGYDIGDYKIIFDNFYNVFEGAV